MTTEVKSILDQDLRELNVIYSALLLGRRVGEIKRYAAHTKDSFYVVAWMDNAQADRLMRAVKSEDSVVIVTEKPETVDKVKPPTRLKNSVFVRPFELFVRMYGTPGYNEIDPTGIVALTYFLMFGIIVGDDGARASYYDCWVFVWQAQKIEPRQHYRHCRNLVDDFRFRLRIGFWI